MLYAERSELTSRDQLRDIPIYNNKRTRGSYWCGVNHGQLADALVEYTVSRGYSVVNESWKLNPGLTDMWGVIDVVASSDSLVQLDIGQSGVFSIGVRHSNSMRYAISFCIGARVVVCSNGLFLGHYASRRKHTNQVNLADEINYMIDRFNADAYQINEMVAALRDVYITNGEASNLILEALRRGIVTPRYIGNVATAWHYPKYEEFRPPTLWSLYNAFTDAAKQMAVPKQLHMLEGLYPLLSDKEARY